MTTNNNSVRPGLASRKSNKPHLAILVVLGAVARAHELIGGLVPGNDAAKMGANGIDTCDACQKQLIHPQQIEYESPV